MICPNCGQRIRKNGIKNGHQRWRGHLPGCAKMGRPTIGDSPMPDAVRAQAFRAKSGSQTRQVTYALFDPKLLPAEAIGIIHREAFVGTAIARSRVEAEKATGYRAVPWGSLSKKEKGWIDEERDQNN